MSKLKKEKRTIIYSGIKKHQMSMNKIMKGVQELYTGSYKTLGETNEDLNKCKSLYILCSQMEDSLF